MKSLTIDSIATLEEAGHRLFQLLDEGDASGALEFAKSLQAEPGQELPVDHFLGCAYVEVGGQLERVDLVEKGVRILSELDPKRSATISYNLANAKSQLWKIAVNQNGLSTAWLEKRCQLRESRKLYESVANDDNADIEQRLKALTDLGNSYDSQGRYLDALDCYDQALRLDPSYGMALGNRGMALLFAAPLMGEHQSHTLLEAAADLDTAIENRDNVLRSGGQSALETFRQQRASIAASFNTSENAHEPHPSLNDPHLDWCLVNRLFLHVSPNCIRDTTDILDPVSFGELNISFNDPKLSGAEDILDFINEIIDAFNTIKQDYVAARYLGWLATDFESPIREHTSSVSRRTWFSDTANYAAWGVRVGMATQALRAAVDLLDKIAVFVHLYFRTSRSARGVTFADFPYTNSKRKEIEPTLACVLNAPVANWNKGLIALIDLSSELEEQSNSRLRALMQYRNAATHRFLVVHTEMTPESTEWSEHVSWADVTEDLLYLLGLGRCAILYLAQMISIQELGEELQGKDSPQSLAMPLVIHRADTDVMDYI